MNPKDNTFLKVLANKACIKLHTVKVLLQKRKIITKLKIHNQCKRGKKYFLKLLKLELHKITHYRNHPYRKKIMLKKKFITKMKRPQKEFSSNSIYLFVSPVICLNESCSSLFFFLFFLTFTSLIRPVSFLNDFCSFIQLTLLFIYNIKY